MKYDSNLLGSQHVGSILDYYQQRIFPVKYSCDKPKTTNDKQMIKGLRVHLKSNVKELLSANIEEADESYEIQILEDSEEILVSANQYVGLVRGLSTVMQLIKQSNTASDLFQVSGIPIKIQDEPRYPYRGFMLDTARHYFSPKMIKSLMDGLSLAKFSVLHWHIVDDEAFPIELESFPTVSQHGAYSADQVYTKEMVEEIVAYG